MLNPGTRLGPYEILGPLGAGGMGEVHRARDTRLGREVALKVIPRATAGDPERIRRFEQEARAAGALSHPNVCVIHDVGVHEDSPFVVMELVEGQSLRERLLAGALPLRLALDLAAQAARGLIAAHDKGIVHRDLKPENLLVTPESQLKILDFGLAKLAQPEAPPSASGATMLPRVESGMGFVLGTASYMAPEQVRGGVVDARADVFALGIVLFEMLAGRRPFRGESPVEVMHAILNEDAAAVSSLRVEAPAALDRFVRRMLAKDPERRIQTARDVRNELEDLLQDLDAGRLGAGEGAATTAGGAPRPVLRHFALNAAHVRQLTSLQPRLVGHRMAYLDNLRPSSTLVLFLHGLGGDHTWYESLLATSPWRTVALTLTGFEPGTSPRPVLPVDDHSRLIRTFLQELVREVAPRATILVGYSAGSDQLLRMLAAGEGPEIPVAGVLGLGTNVSLETCFVSRRFASLDPADPRTMLEVLKSLGSEEQSLMIWLAVQNYIARTFLKFGSELEPLRRYSAEIIAPFEDPAADALAAWFRAVRARVPCVRLVFSHEEAGPAEALLSRHLRDNVLGDGFSEQSFVFEPLGHGDLDEPELVLRHVRGMLQDIENVRA